MAASKGSTIKVPSTRADGHKLAVAMLREMEDRSEECSMFRAGEQDNVALRYLDTLRGAESRDVQMGFAEVLSASTVQGANATAKQIAALRRLNEGILKSRDYGGEEKLQLVNENNAQIRALAKGFMKEVEPGAGSASQRAP